MTVKELIKELEKYDPDLEVMTKKEEVFGNIGAIYNTKLDEYSFFGNPIKYVLIGDFSIEERIMMNKDRHILKSVKAEVLKLNEPTEVGRIYTTDCIEKALADPLLNERLEQRVLFGVITPDDIYDLSNYSHVITNLNIEDNKLMATLDILDTPKGRRLVEALNAGNVGFSVRGQGNVENNIATDYELESVIAIIKGDNNDK